MYKIQIPKLVRKLEKATKGRNYHEAMSFNEFKHLQKLNATGEFFWGI